MNTKYRSENGKLARGVKKGFSEATVQVLRERLEKARGERLRQIRLKKERREAQKAHVKAMAKLNIFVAVESWE